MTDELDDDHATEAVPEDEPSVRYGTRWRLMALLAVPALLLAGGVGTAMATGVLAVSFQAQSSTVHLTTGGLTGDDLGITVIDANTVRVNGTVVHDVRIGVGSARIDGLCIAQPVSVAGVPFTLLITAGDHDPSTYEITVDGLVLDVDRAAGVIGAGGNLQVNKNGADIVLGTSGIGLGGSSTRFGLEAGSAQLRNVDATVRDIVVPNLLSTPDFAVHVEAGTHDCPAG